MITFWVLVIAVVLFIVLLGVLFGIAIVTLVRYVVLKIIDKIRK